MKAPERPSWECGCVNDHAETRDRAWCSACSEWCYEGALCIRGSTAVLLAKAKEALDLVGHLPEGNRAAGAIARALREGIAAAG